MECPNITIDLGNKECKIIVNDKRLHSESSVREVEAGTWDAFEVNGRYYLHGKNVKTKKNTNKICHTKKALLGISLFGMAEVEDKDKIEITTLLPLSLYRNPDNRTKFADLLKGKYTVTNPQGATKTFTITNVEVCAESFSSLHTDDALRKEPMYLVDIGGVDITGVYVDTKPNIDSLFTIEKGMNLFYSELGKVLTSDAQSNSTYNEASAELLFTKKYPALSEDDEYKKIIDKFCEKYVKENIMEPLEEAGYKPIIHKLVFVGGGSLALERYLLKQAENMPLNEGIVVLKDAQFTNVEGAKIMAIRRGKLARMKAKEAQANKSKAKNNSASQSKSKAQDSSDGEKVK